MIPSTSSGRGIGGSGDVGGGTGGGNADDAGGVSLLPEVPNIARRAADPPLISRRRRGCLSA